MPVAIIAGADDRVVDVTAHSKRLHAELPGSTLTIVHDAGHMVHHASLGEVVTAVDGVEPHRPQSAVLAQEVA